MQKISEGPTAQINWRQCARRWANTVTRIATVDRPEACTTLLHERVRHRSATPTDFCPIYPWADLDRPDRSDQLNCQLTNDQIIPKTLSCVEVCGLACTYFTFAKQVPSVKSTLFLELDMNTFGLVWCYHAHRPYHSALKNSKLITHKTEVFFTHRTI
jgi:hypothetical protein